METTTDQPELTLITPMYNEAKNIAENIRNILEAMDEFDFDWEYILVDDGSTDDSFARSQKALEGRSNCRIIHYNSNRGRGYALRRGFAAASGRTIVTTESDLSWGAGIVKSLYDALIATGNDMVIASIYLPGGGLEEVPFSRRALSGWGNVIMRWCFGHNLTMLSGMTRIYRSEVIESLCLESNRKEIHLEIVAKAQALGFEISEIPATIRWEPPKEGQPKRTSRGIAKFIVPHLLSSFSRGAFKIFVVFSLFIFILGVLVTGFGALNKIFEITPEGYRMPYLATYGLILILIGTVTALFAGLSLQITTIYRAMVRLQAEQRKLRAEFYRTKK